MFQPDWHILRILHQSFEIERPKGHWSEVVVHLYKKLSLKLLTFLSHLYPYERGIIDFLLGTATNSEDPNEIPQTVTFHQGLHCMQISKQFHE